MLQGMVRGHGAFPLGSAAPREGTPGAFMSPHGAGGLLTGNLSQAVPMGLGVRRQESGL